MVGTMRKPLVVFYALSIYVLAELVWWAYLLISVQPSREGMILGEGAVFLPDRHLLSPKEP